MNVTVVEPSDRGFVTVFPCGEGRPLASSLNHGVGGVVSNSVVARVGVGGRVCVFTRAETDLVVDVNGFVPAGATPPTTTPTTAPTTPTTPTTTPTNPTDPTTPTTSPPSSPVSDTVVPPSTTTPPPTPSTSGDFARITTRDGVPVRWNPCSTITFKIDPGPATDDDIDAFFDALAVVEQATALDFVFAGTYAATYQQQSPPNEDLWRPSLPAGAEVGITFTDETVVPAFDDALLGFAIPSWFSSGEIVQGTVTIDVTPFGGADPYPIWLHELGHLVGLAHVSSEGELMQPVLDGSLTGFGPGDREGLWNVGAAQACFSSTLRAGASLDSAVME